MIAALVDLLGLGLVIVDMNTLPMAGDAPAADPPGPETPRPPSPRPPRPPRRSPDA